MATKWVLIDGVLREIQVCPPGRAEGAYFQQYSFIRKSDFGSSGTNQIDPNPPGEETPELMTVRASLNMNTQSLRDIMLSEDGEDEV
jgi:hypothetical protein